MNGIINIYKPLGITSHDVVYRIRKITGIKKVGHTGTLDPDADGVLPICIGKGTKLSDMLTATDKRYTAEVKLGVVTDTQDASGTVLETHDVNVTEEMIGEAVGKLIGEIEQIPPMYSAIKQNGRKLYELARAGIEVERKPRTITIHENNILDVKDNSLTLDVKCSKGTYIRTLCHDLGETLGCGAHMSKLTRTQSGIFKIEDAVKLDGLTAEEVQKNLIPVDLMFDYPKLFVNGETERKILNGNTVMVKDLIEGQAYRVYGSDNQFLCISKEENGKLQLVKSFY